MEVAGYLGKLYQFLSRLNDVKGGLCDTPDARPRLRARALARARDL